MKLSSYLGHKFKCCRGIIPMAMYTSVLKSTPNIGAPSELDMFQCNKDYCFTYAFLISSGEAYFPTPRISHNSSIRSQSSSESAMMIPS